MNITRISFEAITPNAPTSLYRYKFYQDGKRKHKGANVRLAAKQVSKKDLRNPILGNSPEVAQLNAECAAVYDLIMSGKAHEVAPVVVAAPKESDPFLSLALLEEVYFKESKFVEDNPKGYSEATKSTYRDAVNHFLKCFGDNVRLSQIDKTKWLAFRAYQLSDEVNGTTKQALHINTVRKNLKRLAAFFRFLKIEKNYKLEVEEHQIKKIPKEQIQKVHITLDDLTKLRAYTPATDHLKKVKDLMVLQCVTGLRIGDFTRLSAMHIHFRKGRYLVDMISDKTGKRMLVPVRRIALEILEKYDFRKNDFKLPTFSDDQVYNDGLKELIVAAGLDREVQWKDILTGKPANAPLSTLFTNHDTARTAIDYFLWLGAKPPVVAKIVGKSLATIMKYYLIESGEDEMLDIRDEGEENVSDDDLRKIS